MNKDAKQSVSAFEILTKFPDEESARLFFEAKRWRGKPVCSHCGSGRVVECKDHKPMPYRCKNCRKHFSVRTGTVLAESRLPLQKWLMAAHMLTSEREAISSTRIARKLDVTQKTGLFLVQRIRDTWQNVHDVQLPNDEHIVNVRLDIKRTQKADEKGSNND